MRKLTVSAALFWVALPLTAQVKLPPYTRDVLPNGAVVLMMPRPGIPLVYFRALVKGGVEAESPDTAGLASLTAQLLRRGTARRSADQFSQELDSLGGNFFAGLDGSPASATMVSAEFLKKDFEQGLDLFADAILHPTFPEDELKKTQSRAIDGIRAMKDNPQAALQTYFLPFFYTRSHPFGNPADEATLARINRKTILDYHQRVFCGRNIIIALAGDFDAAAAKTALGKAFGAVPAGTPVRWSTPEPVQRSNRLLLIDKPDATQTYFLIAQPGIDRLNPDRVKLQLVNTLFGGRFTSMLNEELRVNTGLTYGASSFFNQGRIPGAVAISTYTKVDTTVRAIDLALEILKRLGTKGIDATQLESAKAYLKGTFPPQNIETIDQLSARIAGLEFAGQDRNEIDGFFERIDAITLDQANAVAKKYYRPDGLTFVLLGPAAKIRDQVRKYAPSMTEVSIKDAGWSAR